MSRGFVREGDQEEDPIIAPRAPLPAGMANYVTRTGMELLLSEEHDFEKEKSRLQADTTAENRLEIRVVDIKLAQLKDRIRTAQVVETSSEHMNEVRFGAQVTYRIGDSPEAHTFRMVGVDEADVKDKKIAFTAPIAQALIGMKVDESRSFSLGGEDRPLKVIKITL